MNEVCREDRLNNGIRLMILYKYRISFNETVSSFHKHVKANVVKFARKRFWKTTTPRAGSVKYGGWEGGGY